MTNKAYDRTLKAWGKEWSENFITAEVNKAISLANYDLHFGSPQADLYAPAEDEFGNQNEWSGYSFEGACKLIKDALSFLPSKLYLDIDTETYQENEPEREECEECQGFGCDSCHNIGSFDPSGDWYEVSRNDLKRAIVGKALAEYV